MKPLTIKLNDPDEFPVIQRALFRAGGKWSNGSTAIKDNTVKFVFISETGIITTSNDPVSYQKRIEHDITLYDALMHLESLVELEPYLYRSGQKAKFSFNIDSMIKDQFTSMCSREGLKPEKVIENLIAAEIKRKIMQHG